MEISPHWNNIQKTTVAHFKAQSEGILQDIVYIVYKVDVEGARTRLLLKLCKKKLQKKIYVADSIGEEKHFALKTLHWHPRNGF